MKSPGVLFLLVMTSLIAFFTPTSALALHCKGVFITEGDNQMKLLRNCGKPDFQELNVIGGNMTYNLYYENINHFNYRILIVNGRISEIEDEISGL